jgi:hypothetical protein
MATEIHICRGVGTKYRARVRLYGYRRYRLVGKDRRTFEAALRDLCRAFKPGLYKRGDVLMSADYYDPIQVVELVAA